MPIEVIENFILTIFPMPLERLRLFSGQYEFTEIEGKTVILKEKKISPKLFFLEKGYITSYVLGADGEKITTNIYSAPCFLGNYLSFFTQQPSNETIETINACKIWSLTYDRVQEYYHELPEFREFGKAMLVANYSLLEQRNLSMIRDTAEKRYMNLVEKHPDIVQNVPLKTIASYLGITDTSLSRIRKKISQ